MHDARHFGNRQKNKPASTHFRFTVVISFRMAAADETITTEQESDDGSSSGEGSNTNKTKDRLAESIKIQLAREIQEQGGLELADLKKICKNKTEIFGRPNTTKRKQIQNIVQRWKARPRRYTTYLISSTSATEQEETLPRSPSPAIPRSSTPVRSSSSPPVPEISRSSLLSSFSPRKPVDRMSNKKGEKPMPLPAISEYYNFVRKLCTMSLLTFPLCVLFFYSHRR
jgi:hypothetical protein